MTCHLLLRRANGSFLQYSVCRSRTYHVASKRTSGRLHTRSPVYPALRVTLSAHSQAGNSTRLHSTSGQSSEASTNQTDMEMFRETPSFPSEWISTSPADGTDAVAELVSQAGQPEAVTSALGVYTPVGLLQTILEFVHNTLHLPWWLSIVSVTVAIRVALFPLAVKMQTNAAKIANINPHAQALHIELMAYKKDGNKQAEAAQGMKLLKLYQDNNCHPAKMFIMPFAQMPIFISFFMALRGMARLPVESFKTGGTLWFTDLTVPDPMYALPLLACAMFLSNVEVGPVTMCWSPERPSTGECSCVIWSPSQ